MWFGVILILIFVGGAFYGGLQYAQEAWKNEHAVKESDLAQRERNAADRWKQAQDLKANLEKLKSDQGQALAKEREQLEKRMAQIKAAEAMLRRGGPAEATHAGVSDYLRRNHHQGALIGEKLRVMYLLSTDGFVAFEWEVQWDRPYNPMLRIVRDDRLIRTDAAGNGSHKDRVRMGRRYTYVFSLYDGNHPAAKDLILELVVPASKVWDRDAPGTRKKQETPAALPGERERKILEEKVNGFVAAEETVATLRRQVADLLQKQNLPEGEFEDRMARLDGRITQAREELGI